MEGVGINGCTRLCLLVWLAVAALIVPGADTSKKYPNICQDFQLVMRPRMGVYFTNIHQQCKQYSEIFRCLSTHPSFKFSRMRPQVDTQMLQMLYVCAKPEEYQKSQACFLTQGLDKMIEHQCMRTVNIFSCESRDKIKACTNKVMAKLNNCSNVDISMMNRIAYLFFYPLRQATECEETSTIPLGLQIPTLPPLPTTPHQLLATTQPQSEQVTGTSLEPTLALSSTGDDSINISSSSSTTTTTVITDRSEQKNARSSTGFQHSQTTKDEDDNQSTKHTTFVSMNAEGNDVTEATASSDVEALGSQYNNNDAARCLNCPLVVVVVAVLSALRGA